MCGIAFFINYGTKKIDLEMVRSTWEEMEIRGTDSSGIYFERVDGTKSLLKSPVISSELWGLMEEDKEFKKYKLDGTEKLIMLHTRSKTTGTEHDNNNNMPIYSKNHILIHNGTINDYKRDKKYKFMGEVDSEVILSQVEKYGLRKGIDKCSGSMAIALKPMRENKLYLYRNSNPLDLAWDAKSNILMGVSRMEYNKKIEKILPSQIFSSKVTAIEFPSHVIYSVSLLKKELKFLKEENEEKK